MRLSGPFHLAILSLHNNYLVALRFSNIKSLREGMSPPPLLQSSSLIPIHTSIKVITIVNHVVLSFMSRARRFVKLLVRYSIAATSDRRPTSTAFLKRRCVLFPLKGRQVLTLRLFALSTRLSYFSESSLRHSIEVSPLPPLVLRSPQIGT